ncbi:hypothetical protein [Mycobacterium intracellulare]|uniref:Uncharacterized protein n=1 Tax=Mycobacterium intracellulare TaxID=1767 RepID=A0AAE4R7F6_MYCIT|nr:hypothetical protein [Mycobacterium intracellulare]MDV6975323.1 hypothetical protein [Mycobacterium intracellulare]MDV6980387.1 hypothetical protein [Mycobacterium intracellulare]MDV7010816.1 hypothetical protein [Mycobacterium intracellulare]MDV7025722.1 hypothetical protein [Mycobacterium intracellulare]
MAISFPSAAVATDQNSITLPAHQPGDLIFIFAFRQAAAPPSVPAAGGTVPTFVTIDAGNGPYNALVTAYAIATSDSHTSGTWTNAAAMCAFVIRGAKTIGPIGGHGIGGTGFGANQASSPAVTLSKNDGSSAVIHVIGLGDSANTAFSAGVGGVSAGFTQQVVGQYGGSNRAVVLGTKNVTTSDSVMGVGGGGPYFLGATVEILAADVSTTGFFAMF